MAEVSVQVAGMLLVWDLPTGAAVVAAFGALLAVAGIVRALGVGRAVAA